MICSILRSRIRYPRESPTCPRYAPPCVKKAVTIVVPCFQEESVLAYTAKVLEETQAKLAADYRFEYVFVDDASQDSTWARLEELFGDRPDCQRIRHPEHRGVAAAILTGSCPAVSQSRPHTTTAAGATDTIGLGPRHDILTLRSAKHSAERCFAAAGMKPGDMDLFEAHDAFTIITALSL